MMINRIKLLSAMILFDVFLHWQDAFYGHGISSTWVYFETWKQYDVFWLYYWSIAFFIVASMGIEWYSRKIYINKMSKMISEIYG